MISSNSGEDLHEDMFEAQASHYLSKMPSSAPQKPAGEFNPEPMGNVPKFGFTDSHDRYLTKPEEPTPVDMPEQPEDDSQFAAIKPGQKYAGLFDWMFPEPKAEPTKTLPGPDNKAFPSEKDAEFARSVDMAYGQPYADYFNNEVARITGRETKSPPVYDSYGKLKEEAKSYFSARSPVDFYNTVSGIMTGLERGGNEKIVDLDKYPKQKEIIKDAFARSAIATNRSGIATLGFDPSKIAIDASGDKLNFGGAYRPSSDVAFVNLPGKEDTHVASIVHESIHRGLQKLKEQDEDAAHLFANLRQYVTEESIVRYIMYKTMGDPENSSIDSEQKRPALHAFEGIIFSKELRDQLNTLDKRAAQLYADRRGKKVSEVQTDETPMGLGTTAMMDESIRPGRIEGKPRGSIESGGYAPRAPARPSADAETITGAAIKQGKEIYHGPNHTLISLNNPKLDLDKPMRDGFMTSKGRFVTREEAAQLVKTNGQETTEFYKGKRSEMSLGTEDLKDLLPGSSKAWKEHLGK